MNKKSAKKALLLVLCAILLVVASVMGTLAYLTSSDEVTNTFTVGQVKITLEETITADNGLDGNLYHLIPGSEYTKDPVVTVLANSEDCYVFVKVDNQISDIELAGATSIAAQIAANHWTALDGQPGVYYKEYTKTGTDTELPVFESFTVDAAETNDTLDAVKSAKVIITAYAIQKANITNVAAAWAALNP